MRAIVTNGSGDVNVMHVADAPRPALAEGEVRIRVHTAGVNRADLLQREGHYPPPPGASEILGMECAGEVIESNVSVWKKGDRVMALLPGGGYAEEVVVDAGSVMRKPDALSWEEAGSLPEVFLTAFLNVFELGRAKPGEALLVHGGGSGVGTAAITLGKLSKLRVIATAGSDEKCKRCVAHGADDAINYRTEDFATRAKDVDVILDHIGGAYLVRDLQSLATGGRIVIIGSMGGREPVMLDVAAILRKRQQIIGSTLRARPAAEKGAIVSAFVDRFGSDLEAGRIRPVIDAVFPLDRVADAHRRMEEDHFGKVVLKVL
jgi:putative PIG3 family NAD(P)H quinone oxidoreductase